MTSALRDALDTEEAYLHKCLETVDVMHGDIEGVFGRLRAALSAPVAPSADLERAERERDEAKASLKMLRQAIDDAVSTPSTPSARALLREAHPWTRGASKSDDLYNRIDALLAGSKP